MARLFSLGAEEGSRRGMMDLGYIVNVAGTTVTIVDGVYSTMAQPRTGDYCYYCSGTTDYWGLPVPLSISEVYFGFAVYASAYGTTSSYFFQFPTGSANLCVNANTLRVSRSSTLLASAAFTAGQWNYIEGWYKPKTDSTGRWTIKLNGAQVIDYTGQTAAAGDGQVGYCLFMGPATSGYCLYDDIVFNDTSGTANNSWPGQVRLFPLRVRGAGSHADFTREGVDLGSNAGQAREIGAATSWLQGDATDEYDLYVADAPVLPVGATITNVIVETHARTQLGGVSIKPILKYAANAEREGSAVSLGPAWTGVQSTWPTNLDNAGAAWTESDLASLELGAKLA